MTPLGVISAPSPTHPSQPRRRRSAVRRWPGQSRRLSATTRRARRPGVPSLVPPPRGVEADAYGFRQPNSVSEFGWRKPHPRRTPPPSCSGPCRGRASSRPVWGCCTLRCSHTGGPVWPPVPRGKVQEGIPPLFWFPSPAERIKIIFAGGVYVSKDPSHAAECHRPGIAGAGLFRRNGSAISATPLTQRRVDEDPPQWGGSSSAPKRSVRPLRLRRRGLMPSCRTSNGCPARGLSSLKGSPGTFQRYSAMTSISQRSFFGSSRTATQERAGLPVKYSP